MRYVSASFLGATFMRFSQLTSDVPRRNASPQKRLWPTLTLPPSVTRRPSSSTWPVARNLEPVRRKVCVSRAYCATLPQIFKSTQKPRAVYAGPDLKTLVPKASHYPVLETRFPWDLIIRCVQNKKYYYAEFLMINPRIPLRVVARVQQATLVLPLMGEGRGVSRGFVVWEFTRYYGGIEL
jgi:hypothetical protein